MKILKKKMKKIKVMKKKKKKIIVLKKKKKKQKIQLIIKLKVMIIKKIIMK